MENSRYKYNPKTASLPGKDDIQVTRYVYLRVYIKNSLERAIMCNVPHNNFLFTEKWKKQLKRWLEDR